MKRQLCLFMAIVWMTVCVMPNVWADQTEEATASLQAEDSVFYEAWGIYFDPSTGTVTGCEDVENLVLPNEIEGVPVMGIGARAFAESNLVSIDIPFGVTTIGENAFLNCRMLEQVNLPKTLEEIWQFAFRGCVALQSIALPNRLIQMGNGIFQDCTGLKEISIEEGNPAYCIEDGILYTKDRAEIIFCLPDAVTGAYTVPARVRAIHCYAFDLCDQLTEITLSENISVLGSAWSKNFRSGSGAVACNIFPYGAFAGAEHLKSIHVAEGNLDFSAIDGVLFDKKQEILYCCPQGREGTYQIPETVLSVGQEAFSGCTLLTDIVFHDAVSEIGDQAFSGCSGLTDIELPRDLKVVPYKAFENCIRLAHVTFQQKIERIGPSVFFGCTALQDIDYAGTEDAWNQIQFSDKAEFDGIEIHFGGAETVQLSEINEENAYFEEWALYFDLTTGTVNKYVGTDETVILPDEIENVQVQYIGSRAFENCRGLKEVVMPNRVLEIGDHAFNGCSNLEKITFSNVLERIGDSAFEDCDALTAVLLPDTVKSIGTRCFSYNRSLKEIKLSNQLQEIPYEAFQGTAVESITVPSSVNRIDNRAFSDCDALTEVEFLEGVREIGFSAFQGCGIQVLQLPASLKTIGQSAFEDCRELTSVQFSQGLERIEASAFARTAIESITLPKTLVQLVPTAFAECTALDEIQVEEDSEFYRVKDGMLYDYTQTELVFVPNCFDEILIPEGTVSVDAGALVSCVDLDKITFPASVEIIGLSRTYTDEGIVSVKFEVSDLLGSSFYNYHYTIAMSDENMFYSVKDQSLMNKSQTVLFLCFEQSSATYTVPMGTEIIGRMAFALCHQLTELNVQEGVREVGYMAFRLCDSLEKLTLPSTLTLIDEEQFKRGAKLPVIYFGGTSDQWDTVDCRDVRLAEADIYCNSQGDPQDWTVHSVYYDGNVNVNAVNSKETGISAIIMVAIYDAEGVMIDYTVQTFIEEAVIQMYVGDLPEAAIYKVFLWSDLNVMQPLQEVQQGMIE